MALPSFRHTRAPIFYKLFFLFHIKQRKIFSKPQHYFPVPLPSQLSHSFICHCHCPSICSWWPPVLTSAWLRIIHSCSSPVLSHGWNLFLPQHLLSAPSPLGQEHVSSMWQKQLIHCNIEFHHTAFSYVTRHIWPNVRGGLRLLRYFPRASCPLSTKGIWSSNRKEWEFSAVPMPCETVCATCA